MTSEGKRLFTSPEAQASIARIRAIANGPVRGAGPAEYKYRMQFEMSIAHTFFLDALDQIYKNTGWAVEKNDLTNFTGFALVILHSLSSHHAFEEEIWFPAVEHAAGKPGHLTTNIEQHHAFAPHIHALEAYFKSMHAILVPPQTKPLVPRSRSDAAADMKRFDLDDTAPFDAVKVRAVLGDMVETLSKHLADELDTIGCDLFENVTFEQYQTIAAKVNAYLQSEDPSTFLIATYTMLDYTCVKAVIPLPWHVRVIILPYILAPKHKGFWRYGLHPENAGLSFRSLT